MYQKSFENFTYMKLIQIVTPVTPTLQAHKKMTKLIQCNTTGQW